MSQITFLGQALVAVSAIHLVPAMLTGWMPARGDLAPLTRTGNPRMFWRCVKAFAAAAALGAGLILWHRLLGNGQAIKVAVG